MLAVGATRNGVRVGTRRLDAGGHCTLVPPAGAARVQRRPHPAAAAAGRRSAARPKSRSTASTCAPPRFAPTLAAALLLLAGVLFSSYLDTDPDRLTRVVGNTLLTTLSVAALWCGAWALLSKTFTRQAHFGWHLRVFVLAGIGLLLLTALPGLLAFAFSWPWITDFAFVGSFAVGAAALYFHLLAVEPSRARVLRWVAVSGAVVGIVLTLWFNEQRTGRLGDELYMSHLFPPALRLARAKPVDRFVNGLAPLQARLDRKAKAAPNDAGDAPDSDGDDDE